MKNTSPKDATPLPERVSTAYKALAASAEALNTTSDELGEFIDSMNDSIQRLNLGIEAWVDTEGGWEDQRTGDFERHLLGYAKVNGRWGIALRFHQGNDNFDGGPFPETWLFNDAPRGLRVEGIDKLPQLLERLTKKAESTSKKIASKTADARQLASAMKQAAAEIAANRK